MDQIHATLLDILHMTTLTFVLTAGLFGYAIYGTIVITRILRDIERQTRRP